MFRLSVHIAVLIVAWAIFAGSANADTPILRGSQIKEIFPGSFVVVWKGRHTLSVRAGRDGGMTADYGAASLTGKWKVKGNKLCVSVNLWIGTKKRCGTLRRRGKWYVGMFRKNGAPRLKFRHQ